MSKPPFASPRGAQKAPQHLSRTARRWWDALVQEYGITDSAGCLLLQSALEAFDRAQEAKDIIDRDGAVVSDRFGQQKPHPASAIERDARAAMLQALKALRLDVEPLNSAPGRPTGSGARR